jgi:magnesium-dependent phosphatase 1
VTTSSKPGKPGKLVNLVNSTESLCYLYHMEFPELVVFDLDQCLWSPEMYILDEVPSLKRVEVGSLGEHGKGVVGVHSGREVIRLFPAVIPILQDYFLGKYPGMRIAAASSADTPHAVHIAKTAMSMLEIFPGTTMREVFQKGWEEGFEDHLQIGRTPPLSSNKGKTHFPILRKATGIPYDKMLFFDDCSWDDNCRTVERLCPGVTTIQTPLGIQACEWEDGLRKYAAKQLIP